MRYLILLTLMLTGCTTQLQTPYVRSYGHAHPGSPTLTYAMLYAKADCSGAPIMIRFTDGSPVIQGSAGGWGMVGAASVIDFEGNQTQTVNAPGSGGNHK